MEEKITKQMFSDIVFSSSSNTAPKKEFVVVFTNLYF